MAGESAREGRREIRIARVAPYDPSSRRRRADPGEEEDDGAIPRRSIEIESHLEDGAAHTHLADRVERVDERRLHVRVVGRVQEELRRRRRRPDGAHSGL